MARADDILFGHVSGVQSESLGAQLAICGCVGSSDGAQKG